MQILNAIEKYDLILTEAAVIEFLSRDKSCAMHPSLENALLLYDFYGMQALTNLYGRFLQIAQDAGLPIMLCTPTWRANQHRLSEAQIDKDVNYDAVHFLRKLVANLNTHHNEVFIGGLIGCKNDCYKPTESLSAEDAENFHSWQIRKLAAADVDFLMAATLPALSEAAGIARAMAQTRKPYIISFVINRRGNLLDGNRLADAVAAIDADFKSPPLGYMINCAYPTFLDPVTQPEAVLRRLIGFQANASSLDHDQLDNSPTSKSDPVSDWGARMLALNRSQKIKILGGCCGTRFEHLEYIVKNR